MGKRTLRDLKAMKASGEPITAATAYDYASIRLVEQAQIDVLLPSDWGIATTLLGYSSAMQATMESVLLYLQPLGRLVQNGFILAPLPFGTYEVSNQEALRNTARLMKSGADAVLLQGGGPTIERVRALSEMGMPCAGYLGYLPQHAKQLGPERVVGNTADEAVQIYRDAVALADAGAWGVILHNVPERVARVITGATRLITIGLGGTRGCDGQLVLTHDLVGWPQAVRPLSSCGGAEFFERALVALNRHCTEVHALQFPTEAHTFTIHEDEFTSFLSDIGEE